MKVGVALVSACVALAALAAVANGESRAQTTDSEAEAEADMASWQADQSESDWSGGGPAEGGPRLSVQFCKNFRALKQYLESHFALQDNIVGSNYPAPAHVRMLSKAATVMQVGAIATSVLGGPLLRRLGVAEPAPMTALRENQVQVFMGLFLLSSVAQNMEATGAFEVSLDGKLLFSKLQLGRMPSLDEIVALLEEAGVQQLGANVGSGAGAAFEDRNM